MTDKKIGKDRRRKPQLTLDKIIDVAARIASETGLDAVSFRNIAIRLEVSPMSLYKFVESKDELFDHLLQHVINRMEIPYLKSDDWRTRIIEVMETWRRLVLSNSYILEILINRRIPAESQGLGRLAEQILASLEDGGIRGTLAVRSFWQIFTTTIGYMVFELPRSKLDKEAQKSASLAMEATASSHGFYRVQELSGKLTDTYLRGSLAELLLALLDGIRLSVADGAGTGPHV